MWDIDDDAFIDTTDMRSLSLLQSTLISCSLQPAASAFDRSPFGSLIDQLISKWHMHASNACLSYYFLSSYLCTATSPPRSVHNFFFSKSDLSNWVLLLLYIQSKPIPLLAIPIAFKFQCSWLACAMYNKRANLRLRGSQGRS